jgi:hypothetical protein
MDKERVRFYDRLLAVLRHSVVRNGDWRLLECAPAWGRQTGPATASWPSPGRTPAAHALLVAVNYAANQSQCYVRLPFGDLAGGRWRLVNGLGDGTYDRDGDDLAARGLYLDVPPWDATVFSLTRTS